MRKASRVAVVLLLVLVTGTCTNPTLQTVEAVVQQHSTAQYEVNFHDRAGIAQTSTIVITFTEGMDVSTFEMSGEIAEESDGGVWSTTAFADDTLTVSPATSWTRGIDRRLQISVDDLQTYPSAPIDLQYGVVDGVYYVHPNGSDDGYGTADSPKASIQAAIDDAEAAYDQAVVRVAEGTYSVEEMILVTEDIGLLGGYSADDWSMRDRDEHLTTIKDSRSAGTCIAVGFDSGTTDAAKLEGFYVEAGGGTLSYGVTVMNDGAPVISDNVVRLGSPSGNAYGIGALHSACRIVNNDIRCGTKEGAVIGIAVDHSTALVQGNTITADLVDSFRGVEVFDSNATLVANRIAASTVSTGSYPLVLHGGAPTVRNNVIFGGRLVGSGEGEGITAVTVEGGSPTIQNNTIDGGGASSSPGTIVTALMLFDSTPVIENNILVTTGGDARRGVWQQTVGATPLRFRSNVMFDCPQGEYCYGVGDDEQVYVTEDELTDYLTDAGVEHDDNNLYVDPQLNADYSLSESSPPSVTEGAQCLDSDFTTDIKGATRTEPWSIGAHEYE